MASRKDATTTTITTGMRRCIGSERFGIDAHEAPVDDFPIQPAAKDGLGRMCRPHWTEYTRALRKASTAAKAEAGEAAPEAVAESAPVAEPKAPRRSRSAKVAPEPEIPAP